MKNALLVLNVFLVIAVATLFFLYFTKKTPQLQAGLATPNTAAEVKTFKIAYFETDSIENNYTYYKEVRNQLRNKEQQHSNDLQQIKNEYLKQYNEYTQMQASFTPEERVKREQSIMKLEDTYKSKQQMLGEELQSEGFKKLQDVKKRIEEYLKAYNQQKGYAFIFASNSDLMYYRDSVYNITDDLIKGLNEQYKNRK